MRTTVLFLTIIMLSSFTNPCYAVGKDDVTGIWLSEAKDGKIQIYSRDNKYFGKIIWGKSGPDKRDEKNPDESLRERKLWGLEILQDFEFTGDIWDNGEIYNPKEGKTYSCYMELLDKNTLKIRGYVGISLFGKTTKWTRITEK